MRQALRHAILMLGLAGLLGAPDLALAAEHFQPTGDDKAAIAGDFVLIDKEVNAVARTLTQHGIEVTAIHNHGLMDMPRLQALLGE